MLYLISFMFDIIGSIVLDCHVFPKTEEPLCSKAVIDIVHLELIRLSPSVDRFWNAAAMQSRWNSTFKDIFVSVSVIYAHIAMIKMVLLLNPFCHTIFLLRWMPLNTILHTVLGCCGEDIRLYFWLSLQNVLAAIFLKELKPFPNYRIYSS